ncbi:hypothetical protein DPMN_186780 [Dreissena polymorpha]|uniref:Uncharacterized protein n=1 Tax=Dreissena polymorpha TaxID=45954 RepID=A0A9D4I9P3_DREPO|nr:hypothetical protein DPMN_186780 [Dreissena polymorpha]
MHISPQIQRGPSGDGNTPGTSPSQRQGQTDHLQQRRHTGPQETTTGSALETATQMHEGLLLGHEAKLRT